MRMKRYIAYLLCVAMLMFCVACGKKDTPATETPTEPANQTTTAPTGGTETTPDPTPELGPVEAALKNDAPEHYDFAVEVSINPDFLLFVAGQEVIAYKALNDDAKKIEDRCAIVGRGIDGAVDDIVRFSEQDGYLKDGGKVEMTVVSANCSKSQTDEVIQRAEESIQRVTEDIGIQVVAEVHVEENIVFEPEPDNPPGPDPNDPNNQPGPDPNDPNNPPPPGPDDPNDPNGNEPGGEPRRPDEGCSVCWGTGDCERCDATGVVDCMRCNGTGKEGNGVCPDCNGAGRCECEQCHGTKQCPACGGTGKKPD